MKISVPLKLNGCGDHRLEISLSTLKHRKHSVLLQIQMASERARSYHCQINTLHHPTVEGTPRWVEGGVRWLSSNLVKHQHIFSGGRSSRVLYSHRIVFGQESEAASCWVMLYHDYTLNFERNG